MSRDEWTRLLALGDLDALVAAVDTLAARQDWASLEWLRDRCRSAAEDFGKQLWGAAHFADYRIALDGPDELAASVVMPGAGRFALGPLSEVVAQHHMFGALSEHLDPTVKSIVAQERLLRGEIIDEALAFEANELGVPPWMEPWEPHYLLPTYRAFDRLDGGIDDEAATDLDDQQPSLPAGQQVETVLAAAGTADQALMQRALEDLVSPWIEESDGGANVAVVEGEASAALAALGCGHRPIWRISTTEAWRRMAYAAASGGVHGRRRGAAAGRAAAWWTGACLTGLGFDPDPEELEFRAEALDWWAFGGDASAAWHLGLVVADLQAGWAAAIDAYDREEGDTHDL